jgi:hypothetical protein
MTDKLIGKGIITNPGDTTMEPSKEIMVRQLIAAYPNNTSFHNHVWNFAEDLCLLKQVHHDICVRGGELIETTEQWDAVGEKMGWDSPRHCHLTINPK